DDTLTILPKPDLISSPTLTEKLEEILSSSSTRYEASPQGGLSLKFRKSVQLELSTKPCSGNQNLFTAITYPKRKPIDQPDDLHVIKFTVDVPDASCGGQTEGTKNLKAFSRKFHRAEDEILRPDNYQKVEKDSEFGDRLEYILRIDEDLLDDPGDEKIWKLVQQPPHSIQTR